MKAYKLIKWYPGLDKDMLEGEMIVKQSKYLTTYTYHDQNNMLRGVFTAFIIENSPEFWEEVVENNPYNLKVGKKYKLIKKLPFEDSPEIGYISKPSNQKDNAHYWNHNWFKPEDYPEFWEEVVEKDYEILSFIAKTGDVSTKRKNGKFSSYGLIGHYAESVYLLSKDYNIHSVKRLSDGEIFTINDKLDCKGWFGNIIKFKIIDNKLQIFQQQHVDSSKYKPLLIQDLIKFKQFLFKTEDGVDIYEGDDCWGITEEFIIYKVNTKYNLCRIHPLTFSTKKAAEEYILMNKPCLSIRDCMGLTSMFTMEEDLRRIVKKRL